MRSIIRSQSLSLLQLAAFLAAACAQSVQNIDTSQPIIREPQSPDDHGYFGYSIVLHQLQVVDSSTDFQDALDTTRIIVSAPNGTHPSGQVSNTGLIYTCPLSPGNCDGLTGDGTGADQRLYDEGGNEAGEDKRNQFLGVSMDSNGDRFIVCAHRYVNIAGDDYNPYGVCFHSGRNLEGFTEYQPCDGIGQRATYSVGVCQAGTSAVTATGEDGAIAIGLGAPGIYTWRGIIIRQTLDGVRQYQGYGAGTGRFGTQGYSMTRGHLLTTNREDFVVSVPRRNLYFGSVNVVMNDPQVAVVSQPLQGQQIGEYYGFSLAAVDLTGDGLDELLVGAPLYIADGIRAETGRVYVYRNTGGSLQFSTQLVGFERYSRFGYALTNLGDINGDGREDVAISAPFGSGSGTVYIYHGSATQLITPTPQQVITVDDISTTVNLTGFKGFGTTLASGIDVDANTYNDLAIGSFESQKVFLLRTRPLAQLSTTLTATPNPVNVEIKNCSGMNFSCFNVELCVRYVGSGIKEQLPFTFQLIGDRRNMESGLQERLFFDDVNTQPSTTSITRNATIGVPNCFIVQAYIKNDIVDIFNAFTIDLEVETTELTVPPQDGNQQPIDFSDFPIAFISGTSSLQVETFKDCGGETCVPDLIVTVGTISYQSNIAGETPERLTAGLVSEVDIPLEISNRGDDAYAAQLHFTIPTGKLEFIRVDPRDQFVSCTAETLADTQETQLDCPIGNPFKDDNTINIIVKFSIGDTFVGNEGRIPITFNVSSINPEDDGTMANNMDSAALEVDAQADIFLDVPGTVTPQQLSYSPVVPQATPENVTQLGPRFTVRFVVRNAGPSTVPTTELTVLWPFQGAGTGSDYFLYPLSIAATSGGSVSCNSTFLNPLNLNVTDEDTSDSEEGPGRITSGNGKRRRKLRAIPREITTRQAGTNTMDGMSVEDRTLSCEEGSSESLDCVAITCDIRQLGRGGNAELEFTGYLDERFFAKQDDRFTFVTAASVKIKDADYITKRDDTGTSEVSSAAVRVIPARTSVSSTSSSVEWWVIAVPIILGVIFFVVIAGILWGVGFFRRKKHEEIQKKREELHALNENQE